MVSFKSAITLGLMVSTASAALKHDKRHVHHRRAKAPCTTSTIAAVPYPIGNSTLPAGTGAVSTSTTAATSAESVITYTVVPVPVSPTGNAPPANTGALPSTTAAAGAPPPPPAGSGSPAPPAGNGGASCGVATSYVTVQQTVTVTAGQIPKTTPEVVTPPAPAPPAATTTTSSSPVAHTESPPPPPAGFNQIGGSGGSGSPPPAVVQHHTTTAAAPAASTSPAKTSSPASSGGSASCPSGGKAGIAWASWVNDVPVPFSSLGSVNGACWAYDWSDGNTVAAGIEYVPSLQKPEFASGFADKIDGQPGVIFIKSLNEPDMPLSSGGCAQTPAQAAKIHRDTLAPLQGQYKIGMPAVSALDAAVGQAGFESGLTWLESFVAQVGCDFAFADGHWYGGSGQSVSDQVTDFTDYVETFKTKLDAMCPNSNIPIWFTEIGTGNAGDIDAFMALVAPVLDKDTRVARYSAWNGHNSAISSVLSSILAAI